MALLDAVPAGIDAGPSQDADALNARYGALDAHDVIAVAVEELFHGRIALVSSFGTESAVLLHLLSEVDPTVPVIFLDTGRLFAETLEYRTQLTHHLGLTDVRTITPDPERLASTDPHRALAGFDAWFTGRKRFQNAVRSSLKLFETDGGRIKVNPLANWDAEELRAHALRHGLPEHPLRDKGYPSIGCVPCTTKIQPGEDQRAGRWRGLEKTECGIHVADEADGSGI